MSSNQTTNDLEPHTDHVLINNCLAHHMEVMMKCPIQLICDCYCDFILVKSGQYQSHDNPLVLQKKKPYKIVIPQQFTE